MSNLYDKYLKRRSPEEETRIVTQKCEKLCRIQDKGGALDKGPCKSTRPDLTGYFIGLPKYKGKMPAAFNAQDADRYGCWFVLPTLSLNERPRTLKPREELFKIQDEACFKCLRKEREKLQAGMVYSPDARFWIGVGAASAGLLVGLMVKITRR